MHRPAVRFALTSLLFVAIAFALDRAVGMALDRAFATTFTGEASGAPNHALEVGGDLWVFGSSRAKQHFDPRLLEEQTGLEAYNVAANGQGLPYARALQAVAHHHGVVPSCQVLHVDPVDVFDPGVERATPLLPFAREVPVVVDVLALADPWAPWKAALSSSWRYNSLTLSVLSNIGEHPPAGFRGFVPKTRRRRGVADAREFLGAAPADAVPDAPASEADALLRDFVAAARREGAKVVWVTSPMNRPGTVVDGRLEDPRRERAVEILTSLAAELGVPYWSLDEVAHPEFRDPDLFVDPAHLHADGALLLSRLLGERLGTTCGR